MKKLIFAIGVIFMTASVSQAYAQCNTDKHIEACIPQLPSGFTFLKSYNIDGQGGAKDKVEYSYVFTKGATYNIMICNDGESTDGIILTLYEDRKSTRLNSSHV